MRFLPFWVIRLSLRYKLFNLQLVCVSAVAKCLTASSVMLLPSRLKLFNLQLVCVSAVAKCLTASSVMLLPSRLKLFNLQLVCVSAVAKCLTPSSVMLLYMRFNIFSSQKPWLCWLPGNNFAISIHPSDWRLLKLKSTYKIPSTDLSACTNAIQSRGDRPQRLKSSALQPIFASFFWTSRSEALFSYMQLNSVTTKKPVFISWPKGQCFSSFLWIFTHLDFNFFSNRFLGKKVAENICWLSLFFNQQSSHKLHHNLPRTILDMFGNEFSQFITTQRDCQIIDFAAKNACIVRCKNSNIVLVLPLNR